MIFSLNTEIIPIAKKVLNGGQPVSYSWGNVDALHKWIASMNKKQVNSALGIEGGNKYPLIWLDEGWTAEESIPGVKFTNVNFYISVNSKVETLSENRIPNFEINYQVANDFIEELQKISMIKENTKKYFERANFNTIANSPVIEKQSFTSDIWDTLILSLELTIIQQGYCFK